MLRLPLGTIWQFCDEWKVNIGSNITIKDFKPISNTIDITTSKDFMGCFLVSGLAWSERWIVFVDMYFLKLITREKCSYSNNIRYFYNNEVCIQDKYEECDESYYISNIFKYSKTFIKHTNVFRDWSHERKYQYEMYLIELFNKIALFEELQSISYKSDFIQGLHNECYGEDTQIMFDIATLKLSVENDVLDMKMNYPLMKNCSVNTSLK